MNDFKSNIDQANQWVKQSVTLKLVTIGILALLLLIPSSMIQSIISEREILHRETVFEVSNDWAQHQQISGPILSVPLIYYHGTERLLHILPQSLDIEGDIDPETLKRGLYEVVVYRSQMDITGSFKPQVEIDTSKIERIAWDKAFVTFGVSDLRGVQDELKIQWQDQTLAFQPGSKIPDIISSGIYAPISLTPDTTIPFEFKLDLRGSYGLSFLPVGNSTNIKMRSSWHSPSFQGQFLPYQRDVSDEGFYSEWKVTQLNRNYPSSWIGQEQTANLQESSFGVELMLPLDNYQKNTRMAKYGIMTIALTFLIFFLVEIMNGRRIHPFQYTLVGLALCLFYILLLSISEHSNFELAYVISSLGIVLMISLYSVALFRSAKFTFWMTFSLCVIYGFMFVIMQLADYALLVGSIGLFLILAATMYYTRNINWYKIQVPKST